jgi:hypothetical protein
MFRGKQRPKGLEFTSCDECNQGTKTADLVASLLGRAYPIGEGAAEDEEEFRKLLGAVSNNVPGLLEEMHIGRAGQKLARKKISQEIEGGFLRVNGPLVHANMQTFATKIGFALYYETTQSIIPPEGAVAARWFSNAEVFEGKFPKKIFDLLGPDYTLRNGSRNVSDQFEYSWGLTEDRNMGIFFAGFRRSFSVVAVVSRDAAKLQIETKFPMKIVRPDQLLSICREG